MSFLKIKDPKKKEIFKYLNFFKQGNTFKNSNLSDCVDKKHILHQLNN